VNSLGQEEPRRVLLCTTGFPRSASDTHKPFLLNHAQALVAEGVEVTVLCPSAPGLAKREVIGGVEVVRFRYAPSRFETLAYDGAMYKRVATWHGLLVPIFVLAFFLAARREAKARAAQVLHAHWWAPSGLVAWAAARSLRWSGGGTSRPGAPPPEGDQLDSMRVTRVRPVAVVHLHGSDAAIAKGPLRWLARWLFRRVDAVCVVSDELATWCEEATGVKARVAPMPLRPALVAASFLEPVEPAIPAGSPQDAWVLGVGRLVPEKGFEVLIRAAAQAKLAVKIAGSGPEHEPLAALAHQLGVELKLLGEVPADELTQLYTQATVVAVPSYREGFGMVAAEAAALGKTVVATAVGGIPSVVEDGVNGFLVSPGDVAALAEALRKAVLQPEMGVAGKAMVASLFPMAHAQLLIKLYREVLTKPSG